MEPLQDAYRGLLRMIVKECNKRITIKDLRALCIDVLSVYDLLIARPIKWLGDVEGANAQGSIDDASKIHAAWLQCFLRGDEMKATLVQCQICEHWHMPAAHHNHCPACGTVRIVVRGHAFYYNIQNARPVTRGGFPLSLKRLVNTSIV